MPDRSPSARRYPTKVDWWLAILLVAVPLVSVATAAVLTVTGDPGDAIIAWVTVAGVAALYAGVVWPVEHELRAEALVIRFGLARSRIRYDRIRGVRPSRSLLASPALSIDRLAIDLGGRIPTTISPADREAFLADLAARLPNLRREGDALT